MSKLSGYASPHRQRQLVADLELYALRVIASNQTGIQLHVNRLKQMRLDRAVLTLELYGAICGRILYQCFYHGRTRKSYSSRGR